MYPFPLTLCTSPLVKLLFKIYLLVKYVLNSNLDKAKKYQYNSHNENYLELYWDASKGGLCVVINGTATAVFAPDNWA